MTAAPRIETERLVLRPHRMEDFAPMAEFYASDASRFLGGPYDAERAWHAFAADVGAWELLGFGCWAAEAKATGAFVGQLSLNHPPHFPEHEIGWLLFPGFEGHGYATEGARAVRDFAYGTLGWPTAVSYVNPENTRSIAVARRLGCTEDNGATPLFSWDIVFRHPAPEAVS